MEHFTGVSLLAKSRNYAHQHKIRDSSKGKGEEKRRIAEARGNGDRPRRTNT